MIVRVVAPAQSGNAFAVLFFCLLQLSAHGASGTAESKPLFGPVEELKIIDDFTTESKAAWKTSAGSNVEWKFETGRNIPGVAGSLVQIELRLKDAKDQEPGHKWFSCPSNLNPQWMESIFAAGLLDCVDAIESHGYADRGFAPEENDYPGKLAAIRESMRRHNHGKEPPIYITEAGVRGLLGSKIIQRMQTQFMTRLAIILKGEGSKVFLRFYGIDYDRDGWWGFCFNLEVDARSPWSTQRISPKPTVNAMAVLRGNS
jgi:hypothetical protein